MIISPIKYLVLSLLIFTFSGCIGEEENIDRNGANISVGDTLPSLSLTLSDGKVISDTELNNKVSLIILFSTSCPDCQKQLPIVDRLYNTIKEDEDIICFGISREQGESIVSKYCLNNQLSLPYSAQETREIYSLFAQSGVPRIYIADKNRVVQFISTDNPLANYDVLLNKINELKN